MLQHRYSRDQLTELLLPTEQWRPFPPASDRQAWDPLQTADLNGRRAAYLISKAESLQGSPWPPLPATAFMAYQRTGNRKIFQTPYFERRQRLATLVLAECFEHDGRFIDDVIDGLWAICEETTWCVSAHIHQKTGDAYRDPLGRIDREMVDLFAAETAMVMAEAWYLLGAELDAQTPLLRERVRSEVLRRVVDPVMDKADFHWLTIPMNWNPWCSSNVLGAGYYLLDDAERIADLSWQLMGSADAFLAGQLPDGGCSEGPSYWGVAPGALVILLELLHSRSGGVIDVYDEPLIRDLGLYLPRVHLDGPWFATFADCPPKAGVKRATVYRYGERVGDQSMQDLALLGMRQWDAAGEVTPPMQSGGCGGDLTHQLRELFWMDPEAVAGGVGKPLDVWLPDLQVMVARQSSRPGEGLVVAAKAGNNQEHHNHNDVGQFIITADGEAMIVDVGVSTYTGETFGPNRYQIWCIRGSGHNVPVVNGVEQAAGGEFAPPGGPDEFAATDVAHEATDAGARLTMDLTGAYPPGANLASLRRSIEMERGQSPSITVTDSYEFTGGPGSIQLHLFTPADVEMAADGEAILVNGETKLRLQYDPALVRLACEPWPIDDARLQSGWGDQLTRLTVLTVTAAEAGEYRLTFVPA